MTGRKSFRAFVATASYDTMSLKLFWILFLLLAQGFAQDGPPIAPAPEETVPASPQGESVTTAQQQIS
jgi:hypothetical protein